MRVAFTAALATMICGLAFAQATTSPTPLSDPGRAALPRIDRTPVESTEPNNPAIKTSDQNNPGAPVAGANSYTRGQAKSRIESMGFTNVLTLTKDARGVWRGKAFKYGKRFNVSLDYQGNVATR